MAELPREYSFSPETVLIHDSFFSFSAKFAYAITCSFVGMASFTSSSAVIEEF